MLLHRAWPRSIAGARRLARAPAATPTAARGRAPGSAIRPITADAGGGLSPRCPVAAAVASAAPAWLSEVPAATLAGSRACPRQGVLLTRRTLINLLICLLLVTQQAAYAHAVEHMGRGKAPPAREQMAHPKVCDRCVSFERISGLAPVSVPALPGVTVPWTPAPCARCLHRPGAFVAFQGRAPPLPA